jgi:inner membrane protein
MDIFTHAVAILAILFATGNAVFIPFGVLGAVIIDIDMAYHFIARRSPPLYLLNHGGFTHSIAGAAILSTIAFFTTLVLSFTGVISEKIPGGILLPAVACVLGGAFLHLFLDYLASPGLPLLYPLTEKRFGLSMFLMPGYFLLTLTSIVFLVIVFFQGLTREIAETYAAIFLGILLISAGVKWYFQEKTHGRTYFLTHHPLRWIVIGEENTSYSVRTYDIMRGMIQEQTFEKYRNITPSEASRYDMLPDLRRHRYFSYITTIEKNGNEIIFHDPVRENGLVPYPTWYATVSVKTGEAGARL